MDPKEGRSEISRNTGYYLPVDTAVGIQKNLPNLLGEDQMVTTGDSSRLSSKIICCIHRRLTLYNPAVIMHRHT